MNVKLTHFKVWRTNPDGSPMEGQWGPYIKLSAQFDLPEYHGIWMSCIVKPDHPAQNWQVNNFVEIEGIISKNGNLNFTLPKKGTGAAGSSGVMATGNTQMLEKLFTRLNGVGVVIERIEAKIDKLTEITKGLEIVEPKALMEKEDIDLTAIPF